MSPNIAIVNSSWIKLIELEAFTFVIIVTVVSTSLFCSNLYSLILQDLKIIDMVSIVGIPVISSTLSLTHEISRVWAILFSWSTT